MEPNRKKVYSEDNHFFFICDIFYYFFSFLHKFVFCLKVRVFFIAWFCNQFERENNNFLLKSNLQQNGYFHRINWIRCNLTSKYERLIKYVQNKTKLHLNVGCFCSLLCMWSMFNWMGEDADIFQGFLLLFLICINCKKLGFPANFISYCSEIFPIINKRILKFTLTVTKEMKLKRTAKIVSIIIFVDSWKKF
jgi:hypothetical protein